MLRKPIFLVLAFWAVAAAANGNLPTIYIVTPGGVEITSREAWTPGASMEIVLPDGRKAFSSPNVEIRLRGHSTAGKPKKPYAIRLATACSLLGMPAAKRWQLLANFMDHSNMRNSLALAIARQTSLEWTPRSHMADLVVNGRPQGLYLLCEAITENPRRLAHIGRNGFIAEADTYFDSPARFRTPTRNLPVNIHNPKHPTARQLSAIESFFADIEAALYRNPSADLAPVFSKYIDKTSFADWLIVHELSQNAEPNGPRSCFFHRNGRGKLQAGPAWDFDLAFIDVDVDSGGDLRPARFKRQDVAHLNGDTPYCFNALWYKRLLDDAAFRATLKKRWRKLRPHLDKVTAELDNLKRQITPSALADEQLWHGQDPARFDIHTTFEESAQNLRAVWLHRIEAFDKIVSKL